MAGFNVGALPYFIQYQGQLQQQDLARQQAQQQAQAFQMQQQQWQQAQQDRQRQQAAQAAAGNALPQLLQGGMPAQQPQLPPPPQPPAPGQASQPVQQPQGAAPMPGMGPAPGGVQPPLPLSGIPQGAQQQPIPPFRPMPTTPPQSMAPQGAIPAPPAQAAATAPQPGGGPLTLQGAVKVLQDQGLSGADLMAGLQQLTPVLDSASKAQAAQLQQQFNNELKLQTLQDRHDAWVQASQDRNASTEQRSIAAEQANATRVMLGQLGASIREQALAQRAQMAAGTPDQKIDPDVSKFMARQYLATPDPSVFTNLGRGKQGAANVLQLRKDIMTEAKARGLSPEDVAALGIGVQGEKAFARATGTRTAAIETAGAEFQQVSPLVRQASAALPRSQILPINEVLQAAQTGSGDPRWVKLGQTIETAKNVYARAISPTGTPTEGSRTRADSHFKSTMTPEQINAALDIMDQEIAAARRAPAEVKESQRARIAGGSKPEAGGTPPETKVIGGKTYVQQNGKWYEQ